MLVCNVVSRPKGVAIAGDIVETANAADANTLGNIVFAALVDAPASVTDRVDAYLGELLFEAANAVAVVDVPLIYSVAVAEALTAISTQDATFPVVASVTWDTATVSSVTLSGGNLVATNTGTTSANQGARVASAAGKTSGKYYFEVVWTTVTQGVNLGIGVGTTTSTYTNMGNGGTTGIEAYRTGTVWSNGSSVLTWTPWGAGTLIRIAVDLSNRKFWIAGTTGFWNNNGAANPATNVGGLTIPAGTMVPFVTFGGTSGLANNAVTANFGASTFTGAVPSGFTSGWPV